MDLYDVELLVLWDWEHDPEDPYVGKTEHLSAYPTHVLTGPRDEAGCLIEATFEITGRLSKKSLDLLANECLQELKQRRK